jgi:hypothetical protein
MFADTVALPRIEGDDRGAAVPLAGTWDLDLDRCALEVTYAVLGRTGWRARLRPVEARIRFGVAGRDADGGAVSSQHLRLSAAVAARPAYASLPATRGWFLRNTSRRDLIRVSGTAFPDTTGVAYADARITAGATHWAAVLAVRFTPMDEDRAIVAVAGVLAGRPEALVPGALTRVEMAAEFVRCG